MDREWGGGFRGKGFSLHEDEVHTKTHTEILSHAIKYGSIPSLGDLPCGLAMLLTLLKRPALAAAVSANAWKLTPSKWRCLPATHDNDTAESKVHFDTSLRG